MKQYNKMGKQIQMHTSNAQIIEINPMNRTKLNYQQLVYSLDSKLRESDELPIPKFQKDGLVYQQLVRVKLVKASQFNFQESSKQKHIQKTHINQKYSNNDSINNHRGMRPSHIPIKEAYLWKPKIPQKRLYQQPKFFLAMQRKKMKGQSSVRSASIPQPSKSGQMKGKVLSKWKHDKATANRILYKTSQVSNYPKNQKSSNIFSQERCLSNKKPITPHLHFNLHHVLDKRRQNYFLRQQLQTRHSDQNIKRAKFYVTVRNPNIKKKFSKSQARSKSLIQGSNEPYYKFFTSVKYQASRPRANQKSFVSLNTRSVQRQQNKGRIKSAIKQSNSRELSYPKTSRTLNVNKSIVV